MINLNQFYLLFNTFGKFALLYYAMLCYIQFQHRLNLYCSYENNPR